MGALSSSLRLPAIISRLFSHKREKRARREISWSASRIAHGPRYKHVIWSTQSPTLTKSQESSSSGRTQFCWHDIKIHCNTLSTLLSFYYHHEVSCYHRRRICGCHRHCVSATNLSSSSCQSRHILVWIYSFVSCIVPPFSSRTIVFSTMHNLTHSLCWHLMVQRHVKRAMEKN